MVSKPADNKTTLTGRGFSAIRFAVVLFLCLLANGMAATPAQAQCCACVVSNHNGTRGLVRNQHYLTREHITAEFKRHQNWWINDFFEEYILPAQMMMTEQLNAVGMQQMEIVGALWDAKHQLEAQRLFQGLTAEAHKDYQSSHGMCTMATAARGLPASDRRAETTAHIMSRRSQQRQLGNANVNASDGPVQDRIGRLEHFIENFCHIAENNDDLDELCEDSGEDETINMDIDYTSLVELPMTIDADFTDAGQATPTEQSILSLASLIFSHHVMPPMNETELSVYQNDHFYMDFRAMVAKRSVAENSFYSIVGMKARGSEEAEEAAQYIQIVLEQLGVPEDEATIMLNERPSYFALMDILAQKIYQRPEFYTDLYDTPANVARKDVAMQAVELMVDRDIYKSDLRTESMLAVLLEMELNKHHRKLQGRLNALQNNTQRVDTEGTGID